MPEEIKEVSESEVSPPVNKPKNNLILILIIAVGVGAAGFFAGKIFSSKAGTTASTEQKVAEKKEEKAEKGEQKPANQTEAKVEDGSAKAPGLLKLDEFTVNLNDPFGKRYANLTINLELKDKAFVEKIKAEELLMPKIRDTIFMILSAKTFNDLNSLAGKENLKDEIKLRLNEILQQYLQEAEIVREIYFDKFLLQ